MEDNKIAIVMSTYNGEKYLREQIESILNQKDIQAALFIRDDGSKDRTVNIIEEYSSKTDNVAFWNRGNVSNLGVRDSFLNLLKEVSEANPDIQYFAFADQDDVWKPEKLSTAVKMMKERNYNKECPALYYSNKTFVDADLNLISEEHIKYYGDFFEILWQSLASGCTMVMNRTMCNLAVRRLPEFKGFIHDSWVYRLAKVCGAEIVFDERSYILYRQHGNNVIGSKSLRMVKPELFFSILDRKDRHGFQKQVYEIVRLNGEYIAPVNRNYVDWVLNYNKKLSSWWHLVASPLMLRRGLLFYFVWIFKLIFMKI